MWRRQRSSAACPTVIPNASDLHYPKYGHHAGGAFYHPAAYLGFNPVDLYSYYAALWQNYFDSVTDGVCDPHLDPASSHYSMADYHYPIADHDSWANVMDLYAGAYASTLYDVDPYYSYLASMAQQYPPQSYGSYESPAGPPVVDPEPEETAPHVNNHPYGDQRPTPSTATVPPPSCTPSSSGASNDSGDELSIRPVVTPYGVITLELRHNIRVDVTLDKAVRVLNDDGSTVAISSNGENICIAHSSGKAIVEAGIVHVALDNTLAKITKRGVVFTALDHSLIYLVDASGTKSTTEKFRDLQQDYAVDLFYEGSVHGKESVSNCVDALSQHFHRRMSQGDEIWTIAGVRIKQLANGDVRIARDFGECMLRSSPTAGTLSVSTNRAHLSGSLNEDRLFFLRRDEKRLTLSKNGLAVRNGTQTAGFDSQGKLIL